MKDNQIDHGISTEDKDKIIGLLKLLFPQAKIYLFGSRVRGTHSTFSDIDVAVDTGDKIPLYAINEAKSMLAESNIVYTIDVVDLQNIPKALKERILSEGLLWIS
jgi:predicted nucleotidyltransferase